MTLLRKRASPTSLRTSVEVEEEAAQIVVVHLSASIRLALRNDLQTQILSHRPVLRNLSAKKSHITSFGSAVGFVSCDQLGICTARENRTLSFSRPKFRVSQQKYSVFVTDRTSPQYSEINSFFSAESFRKMPHPATSDGANSRC